MKEYKFKTVTEERQIEEGYISICNKCGQENKIHNGINEWEDDNQSFTLSFGYESKHDGETWRFELCDTCLVEIIKGFKYVPEGFFEDDYDNFTHEEHQKIFEDWKQSGVWEELKYKTYEQLQEMNNGLFDYEYINAAVKRYHPDNPVLEPHEDDIA